MFVGAKKLEEKNVLMSENESDDEGIIFILLTKFLISFIVSNFSPLLFVGGLNASETTQHLQD